MKHWDSYSGNYKDVYALFPDIEREDPSRSWHEHQAGSGGYYIHKHHGGSKKHAHRAEKLSEAPETMQP